jgi:hypothetical protein
MKRVIVVLWVGTIGCSRHVSTPDASTDAQATVKPMDAAVSAAPLMLTLRGDLADAGTWSASLDGNAPSPIQKADQLTVISNVALSNDRIRMFDEVDRALESDDERQDALTYRIHLKAPLLAGHRYALVVDAEKPGTLSDAAGHALDELRFDLTVQGEREVVKPAAQPGHAKHGRHH